MCGGMRGGGGEGRGGACLVGEGWGGPYLVGEGSGGPCLVGTYRLLHHIYSGSASPPPRSMQEHSSNMKQPTSPQKHAASLRSTTAPSTPASSTQHHAASTRCTQPAGQATASTPLPAASVATRGRCCTLQHSRVPGRPACALHGPVALKPMRSFTSEGSEGRTRDRVVHSQVAAVGQKDTDTRGCRPEGGLSRQ